YWAKEEYRPALKHLKKAKKLDPGNPKYYYLEAEIYHGIGNYTLAESAYQDLFRTLPEDKFSGPHKDLAQVYIDAGRYDKAEKELKRCLEIDPQFPFPHYLLGHISLSRGNKKQATRYFEVYMKLGGAAHHDEVRQTLRNLQPEIFASWLHLYSGSEEESSDAGSSSQP
ncbi:MAG: tetratricopeptide repeat protein, partial [Planctomycetota bacterium]